MRVFYINFRKFERDVKRKVIKSGMEYSSIKFFKKYSGIECLGKIWVNTEISIKQIVSTITHEYIHKWLYENEGGEACEKFDNLNYKDEYFRC